MSNSKISSAAFAFFSVCLALLVFSFVEALSLTPYSFFPIMERHPWPAKSIFVLMQFWLVYAGSLTTRKAFSLKRSANLVIISSLVTVVALSTLYVVLFFLRIK